MIDITKDIQPPRHLPHHSVEFTQQSCYLASTSAFMNLTRQRS